ncbi:MAG: DUF167 domain-containing protein [Patescibacteria group bacterium]
MRIIIVEVKPNSAKIKIEQISEQVYKVQLTAQPIAGRANKQLIEVLADYLGVAKSQLKVKSGRTSRTKVIIIK